MNYQKLYDSIMATGRQRGTKERPGFDLHHVIPSCMGGSDDKSNKALLTFHEHFLAHRLLAKIHPKHSGLHYAVWRMVYSDGKYCFSSRVYDEARKQFSDNNPAKTAEFREAQSQRKKLEASKGGLHFQSLAFRGEQSKRMTQLAVDNQHPAQSVEVRAANKLRGELLAAEGMLYFQSPKAKAESSERRRLLNFKLGLEGKLYAQTDEGRAASSERLKQQHKEQVTCSHCDKTGGRIGMSPYHFDNCLQHPDNLGLTRQQIKAKRQAL